jgi:nucleoside-diphosphate-sugar epimerase
MVLQYAPGASMSSRRSGRSGMDGRRSIIVGRFLQGYIGLRVTMRDDSQMEAKMETAKMKVLVVGATGGSGRATIEALLSRGHEVTAFARRADRLQTLPPQVKIVNGDAMNPDDLGRAVAGQDAVIVALGISESPFRVRLRGSAGTPMDIRSAGTRNVIAAMRQHGVRKLVVQTSFGVGETRQKLPFLYRLFFHWC